MKTKMGVGSKIQKLRKPTPYSQQYIADMLGVDKNTYANWENETNDIKSDYLPKLAEIYNMEIKDLFEDKLPTVEMSFNKQVHKGSSVNNSVVLVFPNEELVEKMIAVLKDRL